MPNATTLNDDQVGSVPLSKHLSKAATKTRILSGLESASLISLGQLADDGCTTTITAPELTVEKKGKIILRGKRNYRDGLYDIPIYKTTITLENYIQPQPKTWQYLSPCIPLHRASIVSVAMLPLIRLTINIKPTLYLLASGINADLTSFLVVAFRVRAACATLMHHRSLRSSGVIEE